MNDTPVTETNEGTNDTLAAALKRHGIELSRGKISRLENYAQLLWDWNTRINLTRHTDYEKFVARDVRDTLDLAAFLKKGEHVLDVGSGGGVPGVVLSIVRPDLRVELCDSTGKKAKVLGEIADSLKLETPVWHAKAEELLKVHRFDTLSVRAVARMSKLLQLFAPLWHAFDRILMFKGPGWVEERGESRHLGLMKNLALRKLVAHEIPKTDGENVLLQICRKEKLEQFKDVK